MYWISESAGSSSGYFLKYSVSKRLDYTRIFIMTMLWIYITLDQFYIIYRCGAPERTPNNETAVNTASAI